jgi:hypothetical protein
MADPVQLFGFHGRLAWDDDLRIGHTPPPAEAAPESREVVVPAKLYATSVPLKGGPVKVLEYDHTPEGHRQLANLIRGERVVAVVLGHRVQIEATSVVDLDIGGMTVTDRLSALDQ